METNCIWCKTELDKGVYIYNYKGIDLHFCPVQIGWCMAEWVRMERLGMNFCNNCHGLFLCSGIISVFEHKWYCGKECCNEQTNKKLP